jgi:hypothetical protein
VGSAGGEESSTVTVIRGAGSAGVLCEPMPVNIPMRKPSTAVSPETSKMTVGLLTARGYSGGRG